VICTVQSWSPQAQATPLQLKVQPPRVDDAPQVLELVQALHCAARGTAKADQNTSAAHVEIHVTILFMHHLVG
jgi:hypothetical protein